MRMHRMCTDAVDAVNALNSDHKALTSAGWKPGNAGHLHRMERMDQFRDQATGRFTELVRMDRGIRYPPHRHTDTEELNLLEGDLAVERQVLRAGDYCAVIVGTIHGST